MEDYNTVPKENTCDSIETPSQNGVNSCHNTAGSNSQHVVLCLAGNNDDGTNHQTKNDTTSAAAGGGGGGGATSGAICQPISVCYHEGSPVPVPMTTLPSSRIEKVRKLLAEFLGTSTLVAIVVGSGIQAESLSDDVGTQLLLNAFATTAGLYGLIIVLGPISGAHFNPCVSLVDTMFGDMNVIDGVFYGAAQILGGTLGTVVANFLFEQPTEISEKERYGPNLWISEIIATASLILVIHGCIRTGQEDRVPSVVSLWVGGGYFFTSSSIFANPAVTVARIFTNTFAGINPPSAGVYVCFQLVGAVVGAALVEFFYRRLPPGYKAKQDDALYQRACVTVNQDFFAKKTY